MGSVLTERANNSMVDVKTPVGKAKPDVKRSAVSDVAESATASSVDSVVPNHKPITDSEADEFWTSEAVQDEEQRLRALRQEKEEEEQRKRALQAALAEEDANLDSKRYEQLEQLLNQTDMYTKFLSEQMHGAEKKMDADVDKAAADGTPSSSAVLKRKTAGGRAAGGGGKKQRTDGRPPKPPTAADGAELTETRKMLPLIKGELRDYQLKGVKWLISLYQNGINGILADQMGLGKTVQTIGFLSHLRCKAIWGPFLVIGPLSTLSNWVSEFQRWCPDFPVILYHGSKQERAELRRKHFPPHGKAATAATPVIVTSYEIVIADSKHLGKLAFKYMVVDEGHRLKNFECKLLQELRTIRADNKLLLSGTPLQNNLAELWSLLNFLLPSIFVSLSNFQSWFDFSSSVGTAGGSKEILAAEQRNKVITKLHSILKPFLLRRLKADVEISLPRKSEIILYASMTQTQRDLNQRLLKKTLVEEMLRKAAEEGTTNVPIGKLNNVLMQMRKNCNHPDLITSSFNNSLDYPTPAQMVEQCGKMALLDRLLKHLKAHNHKVLIFSQMTKMLDLIESYLEQQGERACRIDGSVPWQERQRNIKDFNEDPNTWVFLLSTRAGGLGINLTAADTVIIYDSDWNPHQDMQAMDRAHRIGQTRPVLVLRLATARSVEGKMLRRAANKMMLERLVIKKGAFKDLAGAEKAESAAASMGATELLELLRADYSDDDQPQSGVVDTAMMNKLLDRSHLEEARPAPYPSRGVGYEVVTGGEGAGLLSGVE